MTVPETKRVAIVTGGGSGIGRSCAVQLGRQGTRVVVADWDPKGGQETVDHIIKDGGVAIFVEADVSRDDAVRQMVAITLREFGQLDSAINNAGITADWLPLSQQSEAGFQRVADVNFKGVFLCMKYEIEAMLSNGRGGAIVNVASAMGLVGMPALSPYVGAKHGVVGLTRSAALDYATSNIRINVVCPGVVRTGLLPPSAEGEMAPMLPMRRIGEPDEIAAAAIWLCSPEASYITGAALPVDGGHTAA